MIKVLLAVVICWLKIDLFLLAVASIFITNMSGIKLPGEEEPSKVREPTLQISLRSNNLKRRIRKHKSKATMVI